MRIDFMANRICENCASTYAPTKPHQRWCSPDCQHEFRNAELRAARKLWKQSGKPSLEMIEQGESR